MELYEATKGFLTLFEFDVEAHTVADGDFEDGGVKVEQIVLTRSGVVECPPLDENWREDDQGKWDEFYDSDVQVEKSYNVSEILLLIRPTSVTSVPDLANWTLISV